MSAKGVHHTIETLQREVEALRSAATNPAQSQGCCWRHLGLSAACWKSCT